ncbi:LAQU0S03e01772g1_1 [Lachancea quebecensis]|uniref:Crh-like protein n=1 Tax=Lachancea quebecensis TaxID=1654605 RepID=A0A0P1KWU3_9SACH|nr:LAQU0S03e01772g1_1 [Lachancea quebecensis]
MAGSKLFFLSVIPALASVVAAASTEKVDKVVYCNETLAACPEDKPCCSQYGVCGSGSYCLGGCNPRFSHNISACMPMPMCKDFQTVFSNYSGDLQSQYTYLGDAEKHDWIYEGYTMDYDQDDALVLAMPKNSGGTVLSSTRYVWYGKVGARLKTSHGAGVVTAFIMFSSVQDEIDYEYVGNNLTQVQTNFYFEGIQNWTHSTNVSTTDTYDNYHLYEIDWHEDHIDWLIDGEVGRTLYKNSTFNATSGDYMFPQTPARIQISLWPGGNATNAIGTKSWAGGEIDWDSSDIQDYGYYYALLQGVNVTCYDPPAGTKKNGSVSYQYISSENFTQNYVAITNDTTVMGSADDSGYNPEDGKSSSSSSSTASKSSTGKGSSTTGKSAGKSTTQSGLVAATGSSSVSSSKQSGFVQNINSASGSSSDKSSATSTGGAAGLSYAPVSNNGLMHIAMGLLGAAFAFLY